MEGLGEKPDYRHEESAKTHRTILWVKNFSNEMTLFKSWKTRLIVDLSEENPTSTMQIAGISAGIPQVSVQTEYVDHLKNGYVLSKETRN